MKLTEYNDKWRRDKYHAFDIKRTSTAGSTVDFDLWGKPVSVYANANFSIYSAQPCNAKCRFCVEELRPASRGIDLSEQKRIEHNDEIYFSALQASLDAVRPVEPTISITGGEPSLDPRLPRILQIASRYTTPRRTITTNASGLLDVRNGKRIIDWILESDIEHLNISRAHPDQRKNAKLMVMNDGLNLNDLQTVIRLANQNDSRVRLSCVLITGVTDSLAHIRQYLDFAQQLGVDNVIFRRLMKVDEQRMQRNFVVRFTERFRAPLECLLDEISEATDFSFQKQVIGYYYYVEVWRYRGIDVVFEEADLAHLETTKKSMPDVIHELIFHPHAQLASTWQPWDGILGPDSDDTNADDTNRAQTSIRVALP